MIHQRRKDNRGSSLAIVIVTVAFLSVLVTIILSTSALNIQMKAVHKRSVDNFYDAEQAFDEIRTGLQQDVSDAASKAYVSVMEQYSDTNYQNMQRKNMFQTEYRKYLKERLKNGADENKYNVDKIYQYISIDNRYDAATNTGAKFTAPDPKMLVTANGIILKGMQILYRNADNYVSEIHTDIVLGYPDMNFNQGIDVPDLLHYSLIGDLGVIADNQNHAVTIDGNVYAGSNPAADATNGISTGFTVENTGVVSFGAKRTLITAENINVKDNATLKTGNKMTIWTNSINTDTRSTVQLAGTMYVADDTNITGSGDVSFSGEYYGYGNPKTAAMADSLTEEAVNQNIPGYSSAIIISGSKDDGKASLHMLGLTKLMLAGNAYIGSGDVMMGESMAVKSNQIAYLAPDDCFTVNMTNPSKDGNLKDYVDLAKVASYGAKEVVVKANADGMFYYFLSFANAKRANEYFKTYYDESTPEGQAHIQKRDAYLKLYVGDKALTVKEGDVATQKILNGGIYIYDNKGIRTLQPQFTEEQFDIADDDYYMKLQSGWQDIYHAYCHTLTRDYAQLDSSQRSKTVYKNLIDETEIDHIVSQSAVDHTKEFVYIDGSDTYTAEVVNNKALGTFEVNESLLHGKNLHLIVATGDVNVTTDFEGIIIAGGKITLKPGTAITLSAAPAEVLNLINKAVCNAGGAHVYALEDIFINAEYLEGVDSGEEISGDGKLDMKSYITYQNWSKE